MKVYTDQTRRFSKTSSRGNQYIMVLYEIDSGDILVELLRSKTASETTRAFENPMDRLAKREIKTKHMTLDNDISAEFKEAVKNRQLTYQACADKRPQMQQGGTSHSNVQDPRCLHFVWRGQKFPIELWYCLLPQAELTMNLPLRAAFRI